MKKTFTFFVIAILAMTSILNAQTWDKPAYKGSAPVSGTQYYVYNLGSQGFLNRGGEWATEAVVTAAPRENQSATIVKWAATNVSGSTWTFMYNNTAGKYLFVSGTDATSLTYTDGGSGEAINWTLAIENATNNIYTMQISTGFVADITTQYLGTSATTYTSNKGICNDVRYRIEGGDSYTQWIFISQDDYDLYNAKTLLDKYMTYAKMRGDIDLTPYISTYNTDVTADITTSAGNLLGALGRTTVTVPNYSFETDYNSSTDWNNNGSFEKHNSDPAFGWTKDGTYFTEKWTNSGSNLAAGTISQTISGLANGVYGLEVSGHAVQQNGSNPLNTGAFIFANDSTTEISAANEYTVDHVTVTGGVLNIGFKLVSPTACNWVGFDNFRLYYYGALPIPSVSVSKGSFYFDNTTSYSSTFDITGYNLVSDDLTFTAPSGITLAGDNLTDNGNDTYTIAFANVSSTNTITVTWDGTSSITNSNIAISSPEITTVNIAVVASADDECFTPLYSTLTNLVPNPKLNSTTGFGGWGHRAAIAGSEAYCGASCVEFSATASSYPDGFALDLNSITWQPNTTYRLHAWVKAIDGTFTFYAQNIDNDAEKFITVDQTGDTWTEIDETFTTGASATSGFFSLNNVDNGATGMLGYLDNYELYALPSLTATTEASSDEVLFDTQNQTVVVTVSASGFTNGLTVTSDNANFVPSVSSLPATGGTVSVQFTGTVSTEGNLTISAANGASPVVGMKKVAGAGTSITIPMKATLSQTGLSTSNMKGLNVFATNSGVSIQFNINESSTVEFNIYNTNGTLVYSSKKVYQTGDNQKNIDINLQKGVYLVRMTNNNQSITQKVIK